MTIHKCFSPDGRDLYTALDAGQGPLVVLDPCGELWTQFWLESRWQLWKSWRLMPGQAERYDNWDVLAALQHVNVDEGASVLAAALFPLMTPESLTQRLMHSVLTFADDSGLFSGLPDLASQLWADDLWTVIARWSRQFQYNMALQGARALLTEEGAGEAVLAIRLRMMTFAHPHVAQTFQGGYGFRLNRLRPQPGQILFLPPDIRCLEHPELMSVYTFMTDCLLQLSARHHQPFTLFRPAVAAQGEAS